MKKLHFLTIVLIGVFFLVGCSTSKEARAKRKGIDGSWKLENVELNGVSGRIKAQLFNEVEYTCFIGSTWKFNKSNSLGNYSLTKIGGDCGVVERNIRWSIYEQGGVEKQLQFKKLDGNLKEIENGAGYRLNILELTDYTMKLESVIQFEGKAASFIYSFTR